MRLDGKEQHENVDVAYTYILCFEINIILVFWGRSILKDSNFKLSNVGTFTRPDFEVSLQSIDFCF